MSDRYKVSLVGHTCLDGQLRNTHCLSACRNIASVFAQRSSFIGLENIFASLPAYRPELLYTACKAIDRKRPPSHIDTRFSPPYSRCPLITLQEQQNTHSNTCTRFKVTYYIQALNESCNCSPSARRRGWSPLPRYDLLVPSKEGAVVCWVYFLDDA